MCIYRLFQHYPEFEKSRILCVKINLELIIALNFFYAEKITERI